MSFVLTFAFSFPSITFFLPYRSLLFIKKLTFQVISPSCRLIFDVFFSSHSNFCPVILDSFVFIYLLFLTFFTCLGVLTTDCTNINLKFLFSSHSLSSLFYVILFITGGFNSLNYFSHLGVQVFHFV